MILSAHQANFIPWIPYFDKMNKSDVFILMSNCQFEKNGYQNRADVNMKWWTKPVESGTKLIKDKKYADGNSLLEVNTLWILAIAKTLSIDTKKIHSDFETEKKGTDRIIELCKRYECDQYLTNPDAMNKYLDEKKMNDAGIEVLHHTCGYQKHTFEAMEELGLEGTIKMLKKEKEAWLTKISHSS